MAFIFGRGEAMQIKYREITEKWIEHGG